MVPMPAMLGSYVIASLLDRDVQSDSVQIDGSPQPAALTVDLQHHFVEDATSRRRILVVDAAPAAKVEPNLMHH